jgi:hypothetical protein
MHWNRSFVKNWEFVTHIVLNKLNYFFKLLNIFYWEFYLTISLALPQVFQRIQKRLALLQLIFETFISKTLFFEKISSNMTDFYITNQFDQNIYLILKL